MNELQPKLTELSNLFNRFRYLRRITLSKISSKTLSQDDFIEFGNEVESLQIVQAEIETIKSNAFKHIRGLKFLDLSENSIKTIENEAFSEVRITKYLIIKKKL